MLIKSLNAILIVITEKNTKHEIKHLTSKIASYKEIQQVRHKKTMKQKRNNDQNKKSLFARNYINVINHTHQLGITKWLSELKN